MRSVVQAQQPFSRHMAGLHGLKGTPYENGLRVPCFTRWPEGFRSPGRVERLAGHVGVLPTLLEACGATPPADLKLDGRSIDGPAPRFELYDSARDPGETRDLAGEHPEVAARMRQDYDAWFDDVAGGLAGAAAEGDAFCGGRGPRGVDGAGHPAP